MTARDDVLAAARVLAAKSTDDTFTVDEVVRYLTQRGSRYAESTIRTHVVSRMCADSPDHHAKIYADFQRLDRGRYRLRAGGLGG